MPLVIRENKPPRLSIGVLSMLALAYEILLMRLFSIIQWHHFAYMIISLALLGYGASGTFLFLARRYLLPRYSRAYLVNLLLFGISSMACYLVSQHIQFNAEEILWDLEQAYRLMIIYILLALPFFFVANAIGLTYRTGVRKQFSLKRPAFYIAPPFSYSNCIIFEWSGGPQRER